MPSVALITVGIFLVTIICHRYVLQPLLLSPLSRIPGPRLFAITKWRLAFEDLKGTRTRKIKELHDKYGPAVRVGPEEVAFNSLSALKKIYGAGSGFERTSFYDMFDVYGRKNLFTFHSSRDHAERKKLLAHAYSKSIMLKGHTAKIVQRKAKAYLDYIRKTREGVDEIFISLHYFALDAITDFLYAEWGKTACLEGNQNHRSLLDDIVDVSRRKLSWFAVHFPNCTKWLYSRTGPSEFLARQFYPMNKPTTYTGIRAHALSAWNNFYTSALSKPTKISDQSIIERLWSHHCSQKNGGLDGLDIASEAADHLLAGIDTTSDSLMFLIWALSRAENQKFQDRLVNEVDQIAESELDENGIPTVEACDKLTYLDAVIKETLRLYHPLPASEPRSYPAQVDIDGFIIPAGTVVSMSPFSLHRNGKVFQDPLIFNPERWLCETDHLVEMKKWWWAFSSGGRMCIGIHLAMAEMTVLVAALYRNFRTSTTAAMDGCSPGVTSRFEVFYDLTFTHVKEHGCWIKFEARS